jgi:hypothetical protein
MMEAPVKTNGENGRVRGRAGHEPNLTEATRQQDAKD